MTSLSIAFLVRRPWRTGLLILICLLALRLLLWGNPLIWAFYERALTPQEVGWRQADVIREERRKYLPVESSPRYLAVGSSQTGAIYDDYAAHSAKLDSFVMAAMSPLDFVLYDDYIVRRRPEHVLLLLSEFDIAREVTPLAAATAPSQRFDLLPLWRTVSAFPAGAAYRSTMRELFVGEFFPEYKYGFALRGLTDKAISRAARRWGAASNRPAERPSVEQRIAWLREALVEEPIELNMALLRLFADRLAGEGIELIVVEGQYSPSVATPRIDRLAQKVRQELEALAADRARVRFIPAASMTRLREADFSDLSHVTPAAAERFVEELFGLLEPASSTTPLARDPDWWRERAGQLEQRLAAVPRSRLLFIGDSITQGWEREGAEVWQQRYAPLGAINFGISGDRTEHLLWRLRRVGDVAFEPEVTVVLIGTNNTNADQFSSAQIVAGVRAVVTDVQDHWPRTKVLLLGLFPRGRSVDAQSAKIDRVNRSIRELHDGEAVHYLDIGDVFVDPAGRVQEALMPDYLHLSPQGYELWAEAMAPALARLLGDAP